MIPETSRFVPETTLPEPERSNAEHRLGDFGQILVVDDDPQIRLLVARFLQRHGFQVSITADGCATLDVLSRQMFDLIVLDLMLPGRSGIDLCRDIRRHSAIPVIMLTARAEEEFKIAGLEGGADDYMTKPFSPRELLARIRTLLRRSRGKTDKVAMNAQTLAMFEGWCLDMKRRELVSPEGALVDLSTGEYDLLVVFLEHANRILSRETLMEFAKTRGTDPFDRAIDVQISRLRRKIESDDPVAQFIKTVRGAGYIFVPSVTFSERKPV